MATTSIDICNRALILLGSQAVIVTMTQDSVEAKTLNAIYTPVVNWCFGVANWNFARTTAILTLSKTQSTPPPNPWSAAQPTPPWKYEYTLPADIARAQYLTNSDSQANVYLGQPKRCAITAGGTISTNESAAVLVYTSNTVSEAIWPWYFERLVVTTLSFNATMVLNPALIQGLNQQLQQIIQISEEINRKEGLIIDDTTPEWIQALGVPYPQRRDQAPRMPVVQQGQSRDNQR